MHKGCKRTRRMGQLARAKTGVGARQNRSWRAPTQELARQLGSWRANYAVGARQVPNWRANFDLASKKLASTQKTHILHHNNKATQPKAVKYQWFLMFHAQGVATTQCKSKCKLNALDMELTRSWRMYSMWGWLRSYTRSPRVHNPTPGSQLPPHFPHPPPSHTHQQPPGRAHGWCGEEVRAWAVAAGARRLGQRPWHWSSCQACHIKEKPLRVKRQLHGFCVRKRPNLRPQQNSRDK